MKVFVYSKKTNKSIAIIKNVVTVQELSKKIVFITESCESFDFDKNEVKTTSYQN